ncbi:MAG: dihydropteroate synthase [Rhodothermales bacterium]|nr:dihydropteroate synthase [Rhodothermales bacterium]
MSSARFLLRSRGLELDCTNRVHGGAHVMGILNVTPDSFSDGGQYMDPDAALGRAREMAGEGARLIDIGGASSRPAGSVYGEGARLVPADEEWKRIGPVIERVAGELPDIWISVDTFRADVARRALEAGAHLINDITALRFDGDIAHVAAEFGVPMCLMHSVGLPGDMPHALPMAGVVDRVRTELESAAGRAQAAGVEQVVLDPGFGFGKTVDDNLRLIGRVDILTALDRPILIGVSRKSTIGVAMAEPGADPRPPDARIAGSLAATAVGVLRGASIVRTHDVRHTVDFLRVLHRTVRTADE